MLSHTSPLTRPLARLPVAGPDALGTAALAVCLTPEALEDLQQACMEFLAAMPRLSIEGVACLTGALPPIMRLADLPAEQLEEALDGMLHSGRTLMLQVWLQSDAWGSCF